MTVSKWNLLFVLEFLNGSKKEKNRKQENSSRWKIDEQKLYERKTHEARKWIYTNGKNREPHLVALTNIQITD